MAISINGGWWILALMTNTFETLNITWRDASVMIPPQDVFLPMQNLGHMTKGMGWSMDCFQDKSTWPWFLLATCWEKLAPFSKSTGWSSCSPLWWQSWPMGSQLPRTQQIFFSVSHRYPCLCDYLCPCYLWFCLLVSILVHFAFVCLYPFYNHVVIRKMLGSRTQLIHIDLGSPWFLSGGCWFNGGWDYIVVSLYHYIYIYISSLTSPLCSWAMKVHKGRCAWKLHPSFIP